MAIRGKVKTASPGIYRNISSIVGVVTDTATKIDYPYEQPYGNELGIQPNSIVQFTTLTTPTGAVGVSLDPVEKATIESITIDPNTNMATGTLTDRLGNVIPFVQNYAQEMGLIVGTEVRFVEVNINGTINATALKLPNN